MESQSADDSKCGNYYDINRYQAQYEYPSDSSNYCVDETLNYGTLLGPLRDSVYRSSSVHQTIHTDLSGTVSEYNEYVNIQQENNNRSSASNAIRILLAKQKLQGMLHTGNNTSPEMNGKKTVISSGDGDSYKTKKCQLLNKLNHTLEKKDTNKSLNKQNERENVLSTAISRKNSDTFATNKSYFQFPDPLLETTADNVDENGLSNLRPHYSNKHQPKHDQYSISLMKSPYECLQKDNKIKNKIKQMSNLSSSNVSTHRILTKDYIGIAKEYKSMEPYRLNNPNINSKIYFGTNITTCIKCNIELGSYMEFPPKVFFPCEHVCLCYCCYEKKIKDSHQINMNRNHTRRIECPLCQEPIKLVLDFTTSGLTREKYWQWVNEVKPYLSPSFIVAFPEKSKVRFDVMMMDCIGNNESNFSTSSSDISFIEENSTNRKCSRMCTIS